MEYQITKHARLRMQQRGVAQALLTKILENADVERAANDNCRLYRVTRHLAESLHDERLSRIAIIWSDDSGKIVTVIPIAGGQRGANYRKRH